MYSEGRVAPKAQAKVYDSCVQASPPLGFCLLRTEQCRIFKSRTTAITISQQLQCRCQQAGDLVGPLVHLLGIGQVP